MRLILSLVLMVATALAQPVMDWTHPASSPAAFGMYVYGHVPAAHHWRWMNLSLDERVPYLLIIAPRESAKTTWLCNARMAWHIGAFPLDTNLIGSVSGDQALKRLKAIKLLVESSQKWRETFPHIRPDYRRGWNLDGLHVWDTRYSYAEWTNRVAQHGTINTPTLTAIGVGSNVAVGNRFSGLALMDDLHDDHNCLTVLQRDRVWSWLMQTVSNTLTASAKEIVIGTRWNRDDVPGRLKLNPLWHVDEIRAIQPDGQSYWPEQWPLARLERKRAEIGSAYFRAQYQNDPAGLSGDVFDTAWFKETPHPLPPLTFVGLGVDLAIAESQQADWTALVTCGLDADHNLYLLDLGWGHWSMNRILDQLKTAAARAQAHYGRLDVVAIEKVQFQAAVVQEMLRTTSFPARGILPDKDKVSRARPWAIRAEQGTVYADRAAVWWPTLADDLAGCPNGTMDRIDAVSCFWQAVTQQKDLKIYDPLEW